MGNLSQSSDDRRTEAPFILQQKTNRKRYLVTTIIVVSTLAAGIWFGRPLYSKWRFKRNVAMAQKAEAEGDMRTAMLVWEQLSSIHPHDPELRRKLAGFYERAGQLEALVIWKEAVDLEPDNQAGLLGLARTAIRFGDKATARTALDKLTGSGGALPEYHRLRAGLAVLERDIHQQEQSLMALERLLPEDDRIRLNLAALRLADPRGAGASAARATLLELARHDGVRMRAVTELLADVARRWPQPSPERDRALRALMNMLTPARGPLLEIPSRIDYIDRLVRFAMAQPSPTAEDVVSLANWMSLNGNSTTALEWMDSLPTGIRESALLKSAATEFAIRARDWPRLRLLLLAGAWGPVPSESVEQAFRLRGAASPPAGANPGWTAALQASRTSPAGLRMLLRLAEIWDWPAEYRQVLQTIARTMPRETWAWRQLISYALVRGETEQLWQVYNEWRLAMPGDSSVQVECNIMGLLLGRRRVGNSTETAELLRQQPLNAGAGIAHALALWREGRLPEALAALEGLPATTFTEPRYALAAGVILAEGGRAAQSEELLGRASVERLLPEERALVAAAREKNRRSGP